MIAKKPEEPGTASDGAGKSEYIRISEIDIWIKELKELLTKRCGEGAILGMDVQGYERAMKKASKEMDLLLSQWLEEHKRKIFYHYADTIIDQNHLFGSSCSMERYDCWK
ncbi:hypothetical protein Sjap_010485 [Stephania japonica]|uniref:Uncharacterized protein n=1 Tax=Stephania japonica TaxID=461633 RepID=A0AAP0P478_9MAGN